MISYLFGLEMSQVPSDRRVTTDPSGRVTLALEKACASFELELVEEAALDDVEPLPERIVVVLPSMVVDDVTLPPPAVTDELVPPPVVLLLSMTVQVVPSSSVTVSVAKALDVNSSPSASGSVLARRLIVWDFMSKSPKVVVGRTIAADRGPQHFLPSFFLAWPGGQSLLLTSS